MIHLVEEDMSILLKPNWPIDLEINAIPMETASAVFHRSPGTKTNKTNSIHFLLLPFLLNSFSFMKKVYLFIIIFLETEKHGFVTPLNGVIHSWGDPCMCPDQGSATTWARQDNALPNERPEQEPLHSCCPLAVFHSLPPG